MLSHELYASRAEQAGITFSLNLPQGEIAILGDENQLRRAIENVLDNAVKFNRKNGSVQVSLQEEGKWVVLQVRDSGIGIPDSDLPYVFDRFHRAKNTADYPGSGLGLAIVKAVVDGHGGVVKLASSTGGTALIIYLPAR